MIARQSGMKEGSAEELEEGGSWGGGGGEMICQRALNSAHI